MAGSNNFLQFDVNKNNIQSIADYVASTYRTGGVTSGVAPSSIHNRLFYQLSTMVAALGTALANKGYTVSDDSIANLTTLLQSVIAVNADWNATSGVAQILNKPTISAVPPGSILVWPTQIVPYGYLECNGASKLITSYIDLYNVIGYQYGQLDSSHFNLPDYRGYFLRGWDHGANKDPDKLTRSDRGDGTSGDHTGTKEADTFKSHVHSNKLQDMYHPYSFGGAMPQVGAGGNNGNYNTDATGGNETRPININVMYIIKT